MHRKLLLFIVISVALSASAQVKPPEIVNDYASVYAGLSVEVNVLKNDIGPEGHDLELFYANAQHARVEITDSTIIYHSLYQYKGVDSVRYIIRDLETQLFSDYGYLVAEVSNRAFDTLDINECSARINAWGNQFWSTGSEEGYHYLVPKSGNASSLFSMSAWIGGKDETGGLHLAGERYRNSGTDYFMGPIHSPVDSAFIVKWHRVWKISREEIEFHRENWWKAGYEPIPVITDWPVSNPSGQDLAQYVDSDQNGAYDPGQGDYPVIRGDQAILFVYNDANGPHGETGGVPLGAEILAMAYSFDCPEDSALKYTVFFHYDFINRSDSIYSDTYLALFIDSDLGYPWDDFAGCDVMRNSFFTYNGDDFDGPTSMVPDAKHYNDHPAAQSVTILGGPYLDPNGADDPSFDTLWLEPCDASVNGIHFGDGVVDNERYGMQGFIKTMSSPSQFIQDPFVAEEYYQILSGTWKNGDSLDYGGQGHPVAGSVGPACRYLFPGDSDPYNYGTSCIPPNGGYNSNGYYWTEENSGSTPDDRRGIITTGPFTFQPGSWQPLDIALVFGRDMDQPGNMPAVDVMKDRIDMIRDYFLADSTPCMKGSFSDVPAHHPKCKNLKVAPNPARDFIKLMTEDKVEGLQCRIFDQQMREIRNFRISGPLIDISQLKPGIYTLVAGNSPVRFIKL